MFFFNESQIHFSILRAHAYALRLTTNIWIAILLEFSSFKNPALKIYRCQAVVKKL